MFAFFCVTSSRKNMFSAKTTGLFALLKFRTSASLKYLANP